MMQRAVVIVAVVARNGATTPTFKRIRIKDIFDPPMFLLLLSTVLRTMQSTTPPLYRWLTPSGIVPGTNWKRLPIPPTYRENPSKSYPVRNQTVDFHTKPRMHLSVKSLESYPVRNQWRRNPAPTVQNRQLLANLFRQISCGMHCLFACLLPKNRACRVCQLVVGVPFVVRAISALIKDVSRQHYSNHSQP